MKFSSPQPLPKTLHSVPFFALLLAVGSGWLTLAYQLTGYVMTTHGEWLDWAGQTYTGLFYFALFLLILLALVPFLLLWAWAAPRVTLRLDRIADGEGWGGWVYVPAASDTPLAQQKLLRTRRWHLCWQIPLAWLAAAGWALLADTQGGWDLQDTGVLSVVKFLVGGLGLGLLLFTLPVWLITRAFPNIRKMIKEYVKNKYPGLPSAKTRPDADDEPSADLTPREENDDDHFPARSDNGPVRQMHDYAALLNRAHVPAQTQAEQKRRRNLKINLWWQTPALLLLAVFFMALGFEDTFITPLHLFQGRDAVDISIIEPIMFCLGAGLLLP